jgi:AraC-like DNA-binding protein
MMNCRAPIRRSARVTQIALACGFTHMSKFARDFAARFGETPGKVLGRGFVRR